MTGSDTFFKNLKSHRESQGIEISEISERTKINPGYFEAIESGKFDVLPNVYMRLFLRSYCVEIGADPEQAIKDYEKYTTGRVSEKKELKFKPVEPDLNLSRDPVQDMDMSSGLSRRNIIYFIVGALIIFGLIKFVSYLTREAENTSTSPVETRIQPENGTGGMNMDDITETVEPERFSPLPPPAQLTETVVYDPEKLVRQHAVRLPASAPFNFTVTAKTRTKIHITTPGDNLFNGILDEGESRSFTIPDTLRFDLWSARHVTATVNDVELTDYLTNEDLAIRASLIGDGSMSVQFYRHSEF